MSGLGADRGSVTTRRDRRTVVLLDARMARRRRTGVARYVNGLVSALAEHESDLDVRVMHGPPALPRRNTLTSVGNLLLDLAWTHLMLPAAAVRHRADVLHAPFNWAPWLAPCPVVVTVHDLSWEVLPQAYPAGFRRFARMFTRMSVRRATRVITVSRSTAQDLHRFYGTPEDRIAVVYTGITARPSAGGDRDPVVITVGEFEPRKRVPELVAAHRAYLASAPTDPPPCRLLLVGAGGADEATATAACGEGCEHLGFVDDEALNRLYARATLLVSNSAYEGFGLTMAEAASAGCPVLVADTASLREAAGPEAIVVSEPGVAALTRALQDALADRPALRERGERARTHAAGFSWRACGDDTAAVYLAAATR